MFSNAPNRSAGTSHPTPPSAAKTQQAATSDSLPAWLGSLEKGMKYLFCGVAGMSLIAYGCMVYTQEQWRINHQQLQKLKNQERQLAITNARIKNQIAQAAEKTQSGLVSPQPADFLYVPANPQAVPAPVKQTEATQSVPVLGPLGY